MTKYRRLREALLAQRVLDESDLVVPNPAEWDDIRLAHCASYVEAVANGTLTAESQRRIGFPWSPGMVERSRRSVGALDFLGRDGMATFVQSVVGAHPKVERVTKVEDLLPLLQVRVA